MLDFWFEFGSTYTHLTAQRIDALATQRGVRVMWRPFLLGPIFKARGWADSPFNLYAAKGRYMWRDVERRAARLAIPFRRPSSFPRNGLLAARVATAAAEQPWLADFVRAVFHANFVDDRDIGTSEVIADILEHLGQAPEPILKQATAATTKEALRAATDDAQRRGIFGAPTFFVGEEMFWGDDRLEEALDWALSRGGTPSPAP